MLHRILCATAALCAAALAGAITSPQANALTAKECNAKYQAAKTNGTLYGRTRAAFREAECRDEAAPAAAAQPSTTPATTAATTAATAPAAAGSAVFPSAVSPKYAKEKAGTARMHTCRDQYNANKAANANGGLKWIQKGGGYYSECSKRLKA